MAVSAIELTDVGLRFGQVQALSGMTLVVPTGSVFGFLGPNGSGKTSTLRILLGLLRATAGTVRVLGIDPAVDARRVRSQVGVLLENDGLYDRLTAYDNLDYHARIHHLEPAARRSRIEQLLTAAKLWDRRADRVVTWSKGMRQKLAVVRATLHRPALLLLDEPFTGLDPVAAAELRETIMALARDGATVFLTTHDLGHVEKCCTSVAVLKSGAVIALGSPASLVDDRANEEVEVRGAGLSDEILAALRSEGLIVDFTSSSTGARITCTRAQRPTLGAELARRGVALEEIRTVHASLEDKFIALMQDHS